MRISHPQDHRSPLKILFLSLLVALLLPSLQVQANKDIFASQSDFSLTGNSSQPEPEFLPVEEAFRLLLDIKPDNAGIDAYWQVADAYYLYGHRFKFTALIDGERTRLDAQLSEGIRQYDEYYEKELDLYYHNASAQITLPNAVQQAGQFTLKVESQGCADAGLCYPPRSEYFTVDLANQSVTEAAAPGTTLTNTPSNTASATTPEASQKGLWFLLTALAMAIVGGAILNLMPCVFPVLSIKALSLANSSSDAELKANGWAYTAGAVATFTLVAAIMLALRASGSAIGWGFQLQSPLIVSLLIYLFFIMGLALSGAIELGSGLAGVGQKLTEGKGLKRSFFTGALACVVASPCTAPFMGTALGFAIGQSAPVALLVFAALGLGMALPFLLLCYWPSLAHKLPKPGLWMEKLKQFLAFPLYLTAIWLLWVLGRQAGPDAIAIVAVGLVVIYFSLWLSQQTKLPSIAVVATGLALIVALPALFISGGPYKQTPEDGWLAYNPEVLKTARSQGQPVFVNLTADWCITCLANEKLVLGTDSAKVLFEQRQVIAIKGDWTNYDKPITELLNQHNRSGVPLYLVYPADGGEPMLLPQVLTMEILEKAINKAGS